MALVFAGLVPHSPLLAPNIGREHRQLLAKTLKAFEELSDVLAKAQPEAMIIVSSHVDSGYNWWNANVALDYHADLSPFGDLLTNNSWPGALKLVIDLEDYLGLDLPLRLYSQPTLDYGTSIPLLLLGAAAQKLKILPVGYINNQPERQAVFGHKLGEFLRQWPGRVALLGSGDLAHTLGSDQSSKAQARGHKFDQELQKALEQNDEAAMLNMPQDLLNKTGQCAWLAYLTVNAAIAEQPGQWRNLVYESPFGVGSAIWHWQTSS